MRNDQDLRYSTRIPSAVIFAVLASLALQACNLNVERREKYPQPTYPSSPLSTDDNSFQPSSGIFRGTSASVSAVATASTGAQFLQSTEVSASVRIGGSAKKRN